MTGIMFARVHARAIRAFARASTFAKSMRGMAAPCLLALALAAGLAPATSFADDAQAGSASAFDAQAESVAGPLAGPGYEGDAQSASPNSDLSSAAEDLTLASALSDTATSIVSADVALDAAEPVVGSFTVDGLTFAVNGGGITLVSVAGPLAGPESDGSAEGGFTNISIPSAVTYNGVMYDVTAIGAYAFYLSGATSVELPASVVDVDSRAFRSSDVANVEVAEGNPAYATSDGVLYDAGLTSLLLIPEGRGEGVRILYTAEEVPAEAFSHAAEVSAISVDADSPTYSSEDGILYSADGTVLLRVPAGATEITIRDGCTTIAADALEGCANLERINAPATVASISPDIFESVPTVALPAQSALQDEPDDSTGAEGEAEVSPRRVVAESQGLSAPLALPDLGSTSASPSSEDSSFAPQLTAMVALSSADDDLPEVDPSAITVSIFDEDAKVELWERVGFQAITVPPVAQVDTAASYNEIMAQIKNETDNPFYIVVKGYSGAKRPGEGTAMSGGGPFTVPSGGSQNLVYGTSDNKNLVLHFDATYGLWFSWDHGGNSFAWQYFFSTASTTDGLSKTVAFCDAAGEAIPYGTWSNPGMSTINTWTLVMIDSKVIVKRIVQFNGGDYPAASSSVDVLWNESTVAPAPRRNGYELIRWTSTDGLQVAPGAQIANVRKNATYNAEWRRLDYNVGFNVDFEPDDADYPGDVKPDETINVDSGQIPIEDPKRPGYVFEGWVLPSADGTEAVDQELVYQGDDGKWYVDASKLPDYAGDDGRVELTARWTSIISVDVPSSVTFYADLVTQGQQSREGATEGAFGQNKVQNQSQVDLRVVGLESSAVKTEGSTLGADSILKKASAATPATSTQKLLSLYPSTKQWTAEELQDPDAVGGTKAATAVDFDLDDILLEKSFKADDFTIAAGDTLNMGYRLNLKESGQQLDYDKLSTLEEGQSAAIANVSYCFAADALPSDWDEPLWIENPDRSSNPAKYLLLKDIKEAADDLSANGTSSEYYSLYKGLLDKQVMSNGNPGTGPYFQLKVDGVYLPLQLIGICQDTKTAGGKAGLTFQMRDIYAYDNERSTAAGGGAFVSYMNSTDTNAGGWGSSTLRSTLLSTFWNCLPREVQEAIAPVSKYQQLCQEESDSATGTTLQKTPGEIVWLPSMFEVFGTSFPSYNESEALTGVSDYVPFQYMAYQPGGTNGTNTCAVKTYDGTTSRWWLRSASWDYAYYFCRVNSDGYRGSYFGASNTYGAVPCFCL